MNGDVLKALIDNEIKPYLEYIEMWQCIAALGIRPVKQRILWRFSYSGICGYGNTIDTAAWDFYE